MITTHTFNPVDYTFCWVDDWYDWDHTTAHKVAKAARNAMAKTYRASGYRVKCRSSNHNLMSRGGIGSGHPHIEFLVTVYTLEVIK